MSKRTIQISKIARLNLNSLTKSDNFQIIQYLDTGSITKNKIAGLQILDTRKDKVPSRAKRRVRRNTIIYSTVRPNQEHYGFLENPDENLIVSTGFTTIDVVSQNDDPKYIYYLLAQRQITDYLHNLGTNATSSYPSIKPEDVGNLRFKVPETLEDQKRISSVLTAIDSKIELNNKINAELESMAKAVYDYWFVQFDFPDENGKPYKSSGGKMVWNEELKRDIPEGWRVRMIKDVSKVIMGQSPKGESYNQKGLGVPLLNWPADYDDNQSLFARTYTTEPTRLCKKDDLIFCIRATIWKLTFAEKEFCLGRGLAGVRSNDGKLSELLFFSLLQEIERFKIHATWSIIVWITKEDLTDSYFLEPPPHITDQFHWIAKPIFDSQRRRKIENLELSNLRDWLLPMLMNGQVTVSK